MRQLTPEGRRIVEDVAQRHGFSVDAVTTMLSAVADSGGGMAQFNHFEFGGMGQWSQGGMTMIGDMFNNSLKARVDGLCAELAALVGRPSFAGQQGYGQSQSQSQGGFGGFSGGTGELSLFVPSSGRGGGGWWPAELGHPSSTGQQNEIRYAVFPGARRLALDIGGRLSVYDTLDHHIGGVSQQQSGDASLSFTSQYGLVRLADLPFVSGGADRPSSPPPAEACAAPVSSAPPAAARPAPPPPQAEAPFPAAATAAPPAPPRAPAPPRTPAPSGAPASESAEEI
ncbi:MAG TPA: hypothetical protein VES39_05705, partial [Rhodospirillales bacterium]|nr:hypothetical protein [Rhodospirillales bacterium]